MKRAAKATKARPRPVGFHGTWIVTIRGEPYHVRAATFEAAAALGVRAHNTDNGIDFLPSAATITDVTKVERGPWVWQ